MGCTEYRIWQASTFLFLTVWLYLARAMAGVEEGAWLLSE
jgi:hypothetical protein